MVVLKSCNVIIRFCFIAQILHTPCKVLANLNAGTEDCTEELLSVQKLNTGYDRQNLYHRENLTAMTPVAIRSLTSSVYRKLECGYLYSAQLNLQLTGNVVFGDKKKVLTTEMVQDFSFEKETIIMIDTLFYALNEQLNHLWLLFVYAHQIAVFYNAIVDRGMPNDGIIAENKGMHDYVLSEIDRHVVDKCSTENGFNIKSKKCEHCQALYKKLSCWPFFRKKDKFSHERMLDVIRQNKSSLHRIFRENNALGLTYENAEKLSFGLLRFHSKKTYTSLLEEFLVENSHSRRSHVVLRNIISASQIGLRGIRSLGDYQRTVLGTIGMIMLRITWTYALLLDNILNAKSTNDVVVEHAKTFVDNVFTKFLDAMMLNDDRHFKNIYDLFVHCYVTLLTAGKSHINKLADNQVRLVKEIQLLANGISKQTKLPQTQPMLPSKSLDDLLKAGKSFVYQIQHDIGKHSSVRLVQSFLKMIYEKSESIDRIITTPKQ